MVTASSVVNTGPLLRFFCVAAIARSCGSCSTVLGSAVHKRKTSPRYARLLCDEIVAVADPDKLDAERDPQIGRSCPEPRLFDVHWRPDDRAQRRSAHPAAQIASALRIHRLPACAVGSMTAEGWIPVPKPPGPGSINAGQVPTWQNADGPGRIAAFNRISCQWHRARAWPARAAPSDRDSAYLGSMASAKSSGPASAGSASLVNVKWTYPRPLASQVASAICWMVIGHHAGPSLNQGSS